MGEKDIIVNNKATREWHAKTSSKNKQVRLLAGSYHELTKEPNNDVLFESVELILKEGGPPFSDDNEVIEEIIFTSVELVVCLLFVSVEDLNEWGGEALQSLFPPRVQR